MAGEGGEGGAGGNVGRRQWAHLVPMCMALLACLEPPTYPPPSHPTTQPAAHLQPPTQAITYFGLAGYKCPDQFNPADFFLDVVSMDYRTPEDEASTKQRVKLLGDMFEGKQAEYMVSGNVCPLYWLFAWVLCWLPLGWLISWVLCWLSAACVLPVCVKQGQLMGRVLPSRNPERASVPCCPLCTMQWWLCTPRTTDTPPPPPPPPHTPCSPQPWSLPTTRSSWPK